ncbi:P-loop containing nucleoside triphosphate hydrolase protein [Mycena belliarum]|uniref:P-loop containing nucleoside triphosphate hydrolase protein n=1 Tax=Mycena belliarum TaxID=1033014 RepID=A0AAD6XWB3_9AGAR|nr:P-loop containing nucleoside triphosphate hydrolase protein [Mycena belliae]
MCDHSRFSTLSDVILRPYQEQCLLACTEALDSGATRLGVSLPTGSGKTTVFVSLLSRIAAPASNPHASRSLIVVNSIELARQSAEQVGRLFPHWTVEIEQGVKHKASGLADVTVATYQTLRQAERVKKFDPAYLKAIVIDEAHHAAAPSYRRLLANFDTEIKHPDANFQPPALAHKIPILGFSATFSRHDGLALGAVFDRIVYHRDFLEMIKEQWLCDVRFTTVHANINLKNVTVSSHNGDFNPTSLAQVVNTETVNHMVVKAWLDKAGSTRKSTLVFCVNVAHVEALTQTFRGFGVDARYVYSGTPMNERQALIASFKAGQFPVLINCAILTEGADIPNIDCVVVARPTRSRNVLSPGTGKTDCRIIDFVDSASRVSGIVSVPTLFGLDPDAVAVDDETIESLEKRAADAIVLDSTDSIPEPRSVTYKDYDDPFSLVNQGSGAPQIAKMSRHAWVGCGGDVYVLECLGKGYIRIEPAEDENGGRHFKAFYNPAIDGATAAALKIGPFLRSRQILTANDLSDAVRGCDTYAKAKVVFGQMALGYACVPNSMHQFSIYGCRLLRSARWRQAPASPQQKLFVEKRWGKRKLENDPDAEDKAARLDRLTKGEAANIISRLKHGAQARYEKKVKTATRMALKSEKEGLRRAREDVRVGSLQS